MPEKTAQSAKTPQPKRKFTLSTRLKIVDLLHPHWTALTLAFVAVLGETLTDVLEPWPVKIVVDDLLQNKRLPGWIGRMVSSLFGEIQTRDPKLRGGCGRGHCHRGRPTFLSGKTSYNQREPVGYARFATDTVQRQELHPLTATVKESR